MFPNREYKLDMIYSFVKKEWKRIKFRQEKLVIGDILTFFHMQQKDVNIIIKGWEGYYCEPIDTQSDNLLDILYQEVLVYIKDDEQSQIEKSRIIEAHKELAIHNKETRLIASINEFLTH